MSFLLLCLQSNRAALAETSAKRLPEQEFNPLNRFNRPQGLSEIQRTLFCRLKDIPYFCKQIAFISRNVKPNNTVMPNY